MEIEYKQTQGDLGLESYGFTKRKSFIYMCNSVAILGALIFAYLTITVEPAFIIFALAFGIFFNSQVMGGLVVYRLSVYKGKSLKVKLEIGEKHIRRVVEDKKDKVIDRKKMVLIGHKRGFAIIDDGLQIMSLPDDIWGKYVRP